MIWVVAGPAVRERAEHDVDNGDIDAGAMSLRRDVKKADIRRRGGVNRHQTESCMITIPVRIVLRTRSERSITNHISSPERLR